MSIATSITTAGQLFAANLPERCELVQGELRMMSPSGNEHAWVIVNITAPLAMFVKKHSLGYVFAAEAGFIIARDPDTVRAPDVAFLANDRIVGPLPKEFFVGAPDLAVEVISPGDTASEVYEKTQAWLAAGCKEVWLVDPQRKTASICTLSGNAVVMEPVERLTSKLLPGFELPVADLFQ
jgi:Uma2 family endonuclease